MSAIKGVIIDADSLGRELDLSLILNLLDDWDVYPDSQPEKVAERIAGAQIVLSNKVALDADIIAHAPDLKFISVMATGINNIDLDAARTHGISVSNAVGYATASVAQHTLSLMLALSTNLPAYISDVRDGRWQQSKVFTLLDHPIQELAGKTLGIVGYGELGSAVANIAQAFDMNIVIARRPGSENHRDDRLPLDEVLSLVDYLSLHCPLTEATANLINRETLPLMKRSAFIINTARGGLIDSVALIDAIKRGTLAGAAVDVLTKEPPDSDDLLTRAKLPQLLVTPHNAWGAIETRQRLVRQMFENIEAFTQGHPIRVVN